MDVIERLCTRVAVSHGGRLIADGTPEALQAGAGAPDLETAFATLTATRDPRALTAGILHALRREDAG